MANFETLFKEIADSIKPTGNILGITDNNDNTYTFTVDDLNVLLLNGKSISISNTAGFDSNAEIVSNINYVLKTFTIAKTKGQAITTLGTYLSLSPFDRVDSYVGYSEFIGKTKQGYKRNHKDFPSVFLQNGYSEKEKLKFKSDFKVINNLKISFINYTKIDSDNPTRSATEMPYLRELVSQFWQALIINKRITEISDKITTEIPFAPLGQNEAVNIINISVDLTYISADCNTQ